MPLTNQPSSDVKTSILEVATRRFAEDGFAATSLRDICEEVGVRKPSLLYHYPSKEALRRAVLEGLRAGWEAKVPRVLAAAMEGEDAFEGLFAEVYTFFSADQNRARLILREVVDRPQETRRLMGQAIAPWVALITDSIRQGQSAEVIRPDVDPEAWIVEIIVLVIGTFAAADLATVIFDDDGSRVERHLQEIVRMARTSLYLPKPLQTRTKDA